MSGCARSRRGDYHRRYDRQYHRAMPAEKVTLSLSPDTLARARAAAQAEGISLSAWMDRAARRQALRDASKHHEGWLAANPDIRDELDGFDRLGDRLDTGWSDLTDAA